MSQSDPGERKYDAVVIGTGFGGAATAARLVEAGLSVCVLERGRRYGPEDFPELPCDERPIPDLARYRYDSAAGEHGLWDIRWLGDSLAVGGAGYGGGSLVYANVHLRPPHSHFESWPEDYRDGRLDAYYDRAAYMLQVAPVPASETLSKSQRFRQAARSLGREEQLFHPPLAVTFGDETAPASENPFGKQQRACRMCGECITGCRHSAKNSLDYNYLALVDAAQDEGQVSVRTLAEVSRLEPLQGEEGYVVHYHDHLARDLGGRAPLERVRGQSVFLCAGSIGSTEILLRSRRFLPRLSKHVGERYFSNADAIGVAFDLDEPARPEQGPTITSVLLHVGKETRARSSASSVPTRTAEPDERPEEPAWTLIQDGGYPTSLGPLVSLVARSPAWLARNRYRDAPDSKTSQPVEGQPEQANVDPSSRREPTSPAVPWRVPPLVEAWLEALDEGSTSPVIPRGLQKPLARACQQVRTTARGEFGAVVDQVERRLADRAARKILFLSPERPLPWLGRMVSSFVHKLITMMAGPADITDITEDVLAEHYHLNEPKKAVRKLARWAAGIPEGAAAGHDLMLLAMGPDSRAARLVVVPSHCEWARSDPARCCMAGGDEPCSFAQGVRPDDLVLRSLLSLPHDTPVYSAQESVMRDITKTLGGQLHLNPIWSSVRRPVTVHSQGGCAMGESEESVTDTEGAVRGYPGLYVFDGAAFPRSAGVNPSATILAVAERNVERYIRRRLNDTSWEPACAEAAREWARPRQDMLRPQPLRILQPSPLPEAKPIGVAFSERMTGFVAASRDPVPPQPPGEVPPARSRPVYEDAENEGRSAPVPNELTLELVVAAPDLREFLEDPKRRLDVSGSATLSGQWLPAQPAAPFGADRAKNVPLTGSLELFRPGEESRHKLMRYHLQAEGGAASFTRIVGTKLIHDDPGPDAWPDTSRLYVDVLSSKDERLAFGVLHLSLEGFLFEQIRSLDVTGTDDEAQIAWAMASFADCLFGHLQEAYLPQMGQAAELLESALSIGDPQLRRGQLRPHRRSPRAGPRGVS